MLNRSFTVMEDSCESDLTHLSKHFRLLLVELQKISNVNNISALGHLRLKLNR